MRVEERIESPIERGEHREIRDLENDQRHKEEHDRDPRGGGPDGPRPQRDQPEQYYGKLQRKNRQRFEGHGVGMIGLNQCQMQRHRSERQTCETRGDRPFHARLRQSQTTSTPNDQTSAPVAKAAGAHEIPGPITGARRKTSVPI